MLRTNLLPKLRFGLVTSSFRTNLALTEGAHVRAIGDRFVSLTFGVARTRIPSGNGCTYVHEKGTPRARKANFTGLDSI